MKVLVFGSKSFDDYPVFTRAMSVALSSCDDGRFFVHTAGPARINSYTAEFMNVTENGLRGRGIKPFFQKVPYPKDPLTLADYDFVAYLSKPVERKLPSVLEAAERKDIDFAVFRY
jgi:hypothetical protein